MFNISTIELEHTRKHQAVGCFSDSFSDIVRMLHSMFAEWMEWNRVTDDWLIDLDDFNRTYDYTDKKP